LNAHFCQSVGKVFENGAKLTCQSQRANFCRERGPHRSKAEIIVEPAPVQFQKRPSLQGLGSHFFTIFGSPACLAFERHGTEHWALFKKNPSI
jgi:hypothetical protein